MLDFGVQVCAHYFSLIQPRRYKLMNFQLLLLMKFAIFSIGLFSFAVADTVVGREMYTFTTSSITKWNFPPPGSSYWSKCDIWDASTRLVRCKMVGYEGQVALCYKNVVYGDPYTVRIALDPPNCLIREKIDG